MKPNNNVHLDVESAWENVRRIAASLGKPPRGISRVDHLKSSPELNAAMDLYSEKLRQETIALEKAGPLESFEFKLPHAARNSRVSKRPAKPSKKRPSRQPV